MKLAEIRTRKFKGYPGLKPRSWWPTAQRLSDAIRWLTSIFVRRTIGGTPYRRGFQPLGTAWDGDILKLRRAPLCDGDPGGPHRRSWCWTCPYCTPSGHKWHGLERQSPVNRAALVQQFCGASSHSPGLRKCRPCHSSSGYRNLALTLIHEQTGQDNTYFCSVCTTFN